LIGLKFYGSENEIFFEIGKFESDNTTEVTLQPDERVVGFKSTSEHGWA
jgi:hypothetical protein